ERDHPDDEAAAVAATRLVVDRIATVLFWALVVVSALGVLAAPVLVTVAASGLRAQPEVFDAAVARCSGRFPYIVFISQVSHAAGSLNSCRLLAVPAVTPV